MHQLAEVAVPVVIGIVIDRAVGTGDGGAIVHWMLVMAALFAVLSFAGCMGLYIEERAVTGATHWARLAVARRVLDPRGGVEDALPGQVVSLSTVETTRVGEGVGAVILGTGALAGAIGGTAVLLTTSLSLGLVVLIGLPVLLLAVQTLSQPLTARAEAQQGAVGSAAGVAADLFTGLRVLKGLGAEAAAAGRYRRASATALDAALDANRVRGAYLGITLTAAGGFLALVAWMGGRQALDGSVSVGQLVAALGITQFLVGPLGRLAFLGSVLAQARASATRIGEALSAPPAAVGGEARLPGAPGGEPPAPDATGDGTTPGEPGSGAAGGAAPGGFRLALQDLRHGALDGLDLAVDRGELVGVVPTDPAAAGALVDCLDGATRPDGGEVTVEGVPLAELALDEARRAVVVAHHDALLFEGSVGDNVGAAAAAPGDATSGPDLAPALTAAGADQVLDTVAGGLDAPVTEGGRSLSGGQRQRVALARALAADPPVLVLHEPTTAVDAATEHRIAAGLRELRAGHRTTVAITASPTLLAATDRVALLHEGRIVAEGTHAELAAGEPLYRAAVLQ